ncbi:hypothetical protein RSOLAG22IIIB_10699 [Rhizoctonia solani]|uniref:Uncharacterized protein n=1 Tax=Rhizoctonia solani TaxID=456999 RepID=A0A0K6G479_9AGAM|nr:hypothetical protein RSOLAG22IIIB_10699 [Rhizoctonia solani]
MKNSVIAIALFALTACAAPASQNTTTSFGECRAKEKMCTFMFPGQCCDGLFCAGASTTVPGQCLPKLY